MKLLTALLTLSLVPTALSAQVEQVVGPSCNFSGAADCRGTIPGQSYGQDVTSPSAQQRDWWADRQGAFAEVTRTNPRQGMGAYLDDFGEGSLELRVLGQNVSPGSNEWAFWYRFAGGASYENSRVANFGALSALSTLSFDWFRTGNAHSMTTTPSADWPYKTPVMRLRLLENAGTAAEIESELVWEGYYNQCSLGIATTNCVSNTTRTNAWVTQGNMQRDRFWYARPPGVGVAPVVSSGTGCGLIPQEAWSGGIAAFTINQFLGGSTPCIGANTVVTGIAVGIGSRWPLPYIGFVDNVRMSFSGTEVMNTNFDFIPATVVPEPSTWALMGAGLLALGVVSRRRNRSAAKD